MDSARSSLDLVAAAALALLAFLAVLLEVEPVLRVPLALSLALLLPGYALSTLLLPSGSIPLSERAVYTVALSIAVTVLSGVLTQLVLALDRVVWALLLAVLTAAIALLSKHRRDRWKTSGPRLLPPPPHLAPSWPVSLVAIVAAIGLGGWAISIASTGARNEQARAEFVELWALPAAGGEEGKVSVGVVNHQGTASSYLVRVAGDGGSLGTRTVRLDDGGRWQAVFDVASISSRSPFEVTLLQDGQVIRHAYLKSGQAL